MAAASRRLASRTRVWAGSGCSSKWSTMATMIGMPRPPVSLGGRRRLTSNAPAVAHLDREPLGIGLDAQEDALAVLVAAAAVNDCVRECLAGRQNELPGGVAVEPLLGGGLTDDGTRDRCAFGRSWQP